MANQEDRDRRAANAEVAKLRAKEERLAPNQKKRSKAMNDNREHIKNTLDDLVNKFLYYDRKEDEELPVGVIQAMVLAGEVTVDELVAWFTIPLKEALRKGMAI